MEKIHFVVTEIRKKDNEISELKVLEVEKDKSIMGSSGKPEEIYKKVGNFKMMEKSNLIDAINKNLIFHTAFLENERLKIGEKILVYGNGKYIRTDTNDIEEDNLGNLKEL